MASEQITLREINAGLALEVDAVNLQKNYEQIIRSFRMSLEKYMPENKVLTRIYIVKKRLKAFSFFYCCNVF